jgi:hypothetical protein
VFLEIVCLAVEIPLFLIGTGLIPTGIGTGAGLFIDIYDGLFTIGTARLTLYLFQAGQNYNKEYGY